MRSKAGAAIRPLEGRQIGHRRRREYNVLTDNFDACSRIYIATGLCKAKNKFVGRHPCPTAAILKIVEMNYSVLSRFDGPGCGSASDRVSELNTSGRTGEGG
ncbi:hypothetical protein EVAR_91753_1, partial [Eumeta japonica]